MAADVRKAEAEVSQYQQHYPSPAYVLELGQALPNDNLAGSDASRVDGGLSRGQDNRDFCTV